MIGLGVTNCTCFQVLEDMQQRYRYDFILAPVLSKPTFDRSSLFLKETNQMHVALITFEHLFQQQLSWACHLSSPYICLKPTADLSLFSSLVHDALSTKYSQIWVYFKTDEWHLWNQLRFYVNHHPKLYVALHVSDAVHLDQWLAEPISCVIYPTSTFLPNAKGFPVLGKKLQHFTKECIQRSIHFIVTSPTSESIHPIGTLANYKEYLEYLSRNMPEPSVIDAFAEGYHDLLQTPLQPLMDHLDHMTYEVFEKDLVKYNQYEEAIYRAMMDKKQVSPLVVIVVGAGRGPLVDRARNASIRAQQPIHLYAVEKNPNAILTLQAREWTDVTLLQGDMRSVQIPEKADILISELLGSFGDNELSPECLDGACKWLNESGVSIPCSYTPYISCLSSTKLHREASRQGYHIPYVVKFRAARELTRPEPLWTFTHPTPSPTFERYFNISFDIQDDTILHGLAGYFDCILYKDVKLSTVPSMHTTDMTSWFPMYFPIQKPLFVKAGQVQVAMWRRCTPQKVWYEWIINSFKDGFIDSSGLHNQQGHASWIGLQ